MQKSDNDLVTYIMIVMVGCMIIIACFYGYDAVCYYIHHTEGTFLERFVATLHTVKEYFNPPIYR